MESISTCIYKWKNCAIFSPFNHRNKLVLHNLKVGTFYPVCVADENVCITYTYIKLHYITQINKHIHKVF